MIQCNYDTAVVILSYNGKKWHDLFLPKKLEIQLAAIKYSKAVLSYSGWIKINENGEEIDRFILKNE